jgi:hypothetical protein
MYLKNENVLIIKAEGSKEENKMFSYSGILGYYESYQNKRLKRYINIGNGKMIRACKNDIFFYKKLAVCRSLVLNLSCSILDLASN